MQTEILKSHGTFTAVLAAIIFEANLLQSSRFGEPILSPQKISLAFQANLIPITAGHFSTGASCGGEIVKTAHPVTGKEYTLTLHGYEQSRHSFAEIGAKGMIYPEYCQVLSYSITPEIDRSLFSICDCAECDKPRAEDAQRESIHKGGPSAIFMAEKSTAPGRRLSTSSLHFEPTTDVQWRMVFQIKPKDDMEISFPIKT